MASAFDEFDRASQGAIEDHLGEAVHLIGRIGGDYAIADDPDRPEIKTRAVLALSPNISDVFDGNNQNLSTHARRAHFKSEMWITKGSFEQMAWRPRKDDIVVTDAGAVDERRFKISLVIALADGDYQIIMKETKEPT